MTADPSDDVDVRAVGAGGGLPPEEAPSGWRWVLEWTAILVVAVVVAVVLRLFVVQTFYIPSGSMLPTLQIGDRILVDKLSYHLHGIHRGDIVVFTRPPLEPPQYQDLVKRVIGLPGETIQAVDGQITIDGKPLPEPWLTPVMQHSNFPTPDGRPFDLAQPFTIPAGEVFVMGDNRTDSADSRTFGPIPTSTIVGKVDLVIWPPSAAAIAWAVGIVVAIVVIAVAWAFLGAATSRRRRMRSRAPPAGGTA
ncbi:MAG: signal peptidase I [Actinomycetota bacterium]|nr:signal peptidase I [Actinomycetota bacterium]